MTKELDINTKEATRQELLKLCKLYHGEPDVKDQNDNPYNPESIDEIEKLNFYLWRAEFYMASDYCSIEYFNRKLEGKETNPTKFAKIIYEREIQALFGKMMPEDYELYKRVYANENK